MALFNLGAAGSIQSIDDLEKVKSYLYRQEELLRYMFNNLTPEDNYSENAKLIYVADKDRQATFELTLDNIKASYMTQKGVESMLKLSEDQAALTYSTKEGVTSAINLSEQQAAITYVAKSGVVSAINLSEEAIKIAASKITLEGVVTANQNFKILLDGSIEAKNAKFSGSITGSSITGSSLTLGGANNANGTITIKNANGVTIGTFSNAGLNVTTGTISGTTITGGTITGSHLYGSYIGSTSDDFYVVEDGSSVEVGVPGFWFGDDIMHSNWFGSITNPATGDDTAGINGGNGYAGFRKLYLLDSWYNGQDGTFWDVDRTLKWLDARLSSIESAGCRSNTCNCDMGDGGGTCIGEACNSQSCSWEQGGCDPVDVIDCDIDQDGESCWSQSGCGNDSCSSDGSGCSDYICSHTCADGECGPGDGM